jgi:transposase
MQSSIIMSKEEKKRNLSNSKVKLLKYSVGVDMSKEKFEACISSIDVTQYTKVVATRSFTNTQKGIENFFKWVKSKCKHPIPVTYIVEATGVYYERLAYFLTEQECHVSVVLPNRAKKYLVSIGVKSKNDKIDSKGLARMGAEQHLEQWQPPAESIMQLRHLTRQKESLEKTKTSINNQLKALQSAKYVNNEVVAQQESLIQLLEEKIKETEKLITKQIREDEELYEKVKRITKVKGLSDLTVATVIAETNAFTHFNNQKQLVSYAGYDVIENQSGKHVGKTKISKKGNARIRRIMYMAALTAVSSNEPVFKNLYARVYERTKIKMKGYVAVQRKLLVLIYTLWENGQQYYPNYFHTSGKNEPKFLFSHGPAGDIKNPGIAAGTLDELPYKKSPKVLFSQK